VLILFQVLRYWHDAEEARVVIVGLVIVDAMPIAGSSVAWSQNSEGSVALSLELVVVSTLTSPVTTPLIFASVRAGTTRDYAQILGHLSNGSTGDVRRLSDGGRNRRACRLRDASTFVRRLAADRPTHRTSPSGNIS
jgi:hypothetical protein